MRSRKYAALDRRASDYHALTRSDPRALDLDHHRHALLEQDTMSVRVHQQHVAGQRSEEAHRVTLVQPPVGALAHRALEANALDLDRHVPWRVRETFRDFR